MIRLPNLKSDPKVKIIECRRSRKMKRSIRKMDKGMKRMRKHGSTNRRGNCPNFYDSHYRESE